ncbi:MAG: OsmC family protein [Peptococcaceae bacterium]|nr:OsmC family protein [Peptococcaceae bacterium]
MAILNGIDLEVGKKIIETVKNSPEAGKTLWRSTTLWQGGTKAETTIRGFKVNTDEPTNLGGTDTAPNPVEMVLAALGGCLIVGYSLNAAMLGVELQKIEISLEGDIDLPGFFGLPSDILPGYSSVRARVFIKSDASLDQLDEVHNRVLATSPVGLTLSKNVNLEIELVRRRTA